jgi:NAD dependent epimerase/dehydratase family enzyme
MLHRPVLIRVPAEPLRMLLGEMASMLVDGPVITSPRLHASNFAFTFPSLRSALMDLT